MQGAAATSWSDRDAVLAARGLACRRGERLVFAGLDFALRSGGVLLLRGPNGSGKSSLLRLIAGLLPAERGVLHWRGAPLPDPEAWRAEIAYLGHLDAAKAELTPREDLRFWLALRGVPAGRVETALERLGLSGLADLPCRMLSQGQRRRLALARIAAAGARIWLLDEPFNALDDASRDAVEALLEDHGRRGGLALVAAHGAGPRAAGMQELDLGRIAAPPPEAP
jgi:heme exporter protein A